MGSHMPPEPFNQAEFIADRFGGTTALADALGLPYHQVRDWCRRTRFIPEKHRPSVLIAARERGVDVTPFDFIRHLVRYADAA